jgi:exopolysaccharide production protein ExoZ
VSGWSRFIYTHGKVLRRKSGYFQLKSGKLARRKIRGIFIIATSGKFEWLQALRAIAALLVVGFHFRQMLQTHGQLPDLLNQTLKFGFFGVDIFFVLSGFVVSISAHRAIQSKRDATYFLLRRFVRIFLGYWPALLLLYIALSIAQRPPDSSLAFTSIFLLSPQHSMNWLNVAWSLTYELYFYLLVVALFLAVPPAKRFIAALILTVFVLAWNWVFFMLAPALVFDGTQPGAFFLSGLVAEFFSGVVLALLLARRRLSASILVLLGSALLLIGLLIGAREGTYANVNFFRALSFGCAGLGCVMVACGLERSSLRPPRWLIAIGDASFSLYLLHILFLFALGAATRTDICKQAVISCNAMVGIWPFFTVFFAVLWFRCIEKPLYERAAEFIRLRQKPNGESPARIAAAEPIR